MVSEKQNPPSPPSGEGRRRSGRFPVLVPVEVSWTESGGEAVKVEAQAREVSAHGGLLQFLDTDRHPAVGTELELTNLFSADVTWARVSSLRRSGQTTSLSVAVELFVPSETFWGLTFRLKKTTAELLKLDQAIKSGDVDLRVLREFRDAVDYVRKTAWAVQEWQERQLQHRDTAIVLPLLTTERIRRTAQLCSSVAEDLKTHEVTAETPGLDKLFRTIKHLCDELTRILRENQNH